MNFATTILGSTAVHKLQAVQQQPVLIVGKDRLTRHELAAVDCYNFLAAANLTRVLKALEVPSLQDLYERIAPSALALPHLGVFSLAVLGAAFEARKIGGATPLETWARKHAGNADSPMVTFYTLKKREAEGLAEEKKAGKQRRRARRAKAHQLRVARFTA